MLLRLPQNSQNRLSMLEDIDILLETSAPGTYIFQTPTEIDCQFIQISQGHSTPQECIGIDFGRFMIAKISA